MLKVGRCVRLPRLKLDWAVISDEGRAIDDCAESPES